MGERQEESYAPIPEILPSRHGLPGRIAPTDRLRRAHRHAMVSLNQPAGTGDATEGRDLIDQCPSKEPGLQEELERDEWRHWVQDSMARLSEPLRQALMLSDYHGLKYREVAAVLHIPEGRSSRGDPPPSRKCVTWRGSALSWAPVDALARAE